MDKILHLPVKLTKSDKKLKTTQKSLFTSTISYSKKFLLLEVRRTIMTLLRSNIYAQINSERSTSRSENYKNQPAWSFRLPFLKVFQTHV